MAYGDGYGGGYGGNSTVTFATYDTPHRPETVNHSNDWSLWRYYDGIRTRRTIIITNGVATPSPGAASLTADDYANADTGSGENGLAIWHGDDSVQTVTSAEGAILIAAGYVVS